MSTLPIPTSIKQIYKQTKNTVLQVPEIEKRVKEATSNEKWGPTSTQMRDIAQATFSYHDLPIIMNAIWRRLNDHGKYWRHVYKSLLLIDYLIRNGSEQVVRECRDHIVAIQTLTEFQYIDERDQDVGLSVRERAKQIAEFIHDEKRIKAEREKAKNTAKKFLVGIGSEVGGMGPGHYNDRDYDRNEYNYNEDNNNNRSSSRESSRYNPDDDYGVDEEEQQQQHDYSRENNRDRDNYNNNNNNSNNNMNRDNSNRRPRAASGSSNTNINNNNNNNNNNNQRSNNNTQNATGNLFSIDDVMSGPTPAKQQEIDFFSAPPPANNNNFGFPPSNNSFNNNNFNNNFNNNSNNFNNNNNGFTPFQSSNSFQENNNADWASFPNDNTNHNNNTSNNNNNNNNTNNNSNTNANEQKKEIDPWAASHLFNLGGLSENKEQPKTTQSRTPMGAIPGQSKGMGAPMSNVNPVFPTTTTTPNYGGPMGGNINYGMNVNMGYQPNAPLNNNMAPGFPNQQFQNQQFPNQQFQNQQFPNQQFQTYNNQQFQNKPNQPNNWNPF